MSQLTLDLAKKLIESAEAEANNLEISMVISIVDAGGNLLAIHRMDDAWIASIDISQNKAWTAVALKTATANLADATIPQTELYGLNTTNNGRIVVFGGGIPLVKDGKVWGAVGASGSAVANDIKVAEAAAKAFEQLV